MTTSTTVIVQPVSVEAVLSKLELSRISLGYWPGFGTPLLEEALATPRSARLVRVFPCRFDSEASQAAAAKKRGWRQATFHEAAEFVQACLWKGDVLAYLPLAVFSARFLAKPPGNVCVPIFVRHLESAFSVADLRAEVDVGWLRDGGGPWELVAEI